MPIKYHCPKCGRRYIEWGAEKLKFRCPECKDELVRVGKGSEKPARKPSLRARVRPAGLAVRAEPAEGPELDEEELEPVEEETPVFVGAPEEVEETAFTPEAVIEPELPDGETLPEAEPLDFGVEPVPLQEDASEFVEGGAGDEWVE